MDVQRNDLKKRKQKKRIFYSITAVLLGGAGLYFLFHLDSAAPTVDRTAVWIEEVKRGPFEVKVRGIGTLVPEDVRWITAENSSRVDKILILPGAKVEADTAILVLKNPELEQTARSAELELASAQAQLANQRVREEDSLLEMEYQIAQLEANYENAKLDVRVNEELFSEGLVAERDLLRSKLMEEQLKRQTEILTRRLNSRREQMEQNLAPAIATVEQERERVELLNQQVKSLRVTAGIEGILQRLPVEVGQQVNAGMLIAQVADPSKLKAVIRIPETQAKDIQVGQPTQIDTRNGFVAGEVARINPTVEGGTVDVDVRLTGDLPKGARADLTVEGNILLASLPDVLFVSRPAFGRANATLGVFKLTSPSEAMRTSVTFGRTSVSEIEIVSGLNQGDQIILSDTTQWNDNSKLLLN